MVSIQYRDRGDLLRLLDYAQSGSIERKRRAAEDLPRYIQRVPDMQDDVVNTVYDLCEDPSAEVSIATPVCHVYAAERFWARSEWRGIKLLWRCQGKIKEY